MKLKNTYKALIVLSILGIFLSGQSLFAVSDFTLKRVDGSIYRLGDQLGKKLILIDFWATWCKPCKKYLKKLQKIDEIYGDQISVLAISVDNTSAQSRVESYVKSKKFTFTVLFDAENQVAGRLNPSGKIPFTLLINREGKIVYTHAGYMAGFDRILRKKIEKWL